MDILVSRQQMWTCYKGQRDKTAEDLFEDAQNFYHFFQDGQIELIKIHHDKKCLTYMGYSVADSGNIYQAGWTIAGNNTNICIIQFMKCKWDVHKIGK